MHRTDRILRTLQRRQASRSRRPWSWPLLLASLVLAAGCASTEPAPGKVATAGKAVPEACAARTGVGREICIECDGLMPHQRLVCEQKLFWSKCGKGMRLFKDSWCADQSQQR